MPRGLLEHIAIRIENSQMYCCCQKKKKKEEKCQEKKGRKEGRGEREKGKKWKNKKSPGRSLTKKQTRPSEIPRTCVPFSPNGPEFHGLPSSRSNTGVLYYPTHRTTRLPHRLGQDQAPLDTFRHAPSIYASTTEGHPKQKTVRREPATESGSPSRPFGRPKIPAAIKVESPQLNPQGHVGHYATAQLHSERAGSQKP